MRKGMSGIKQWAVWVLGGLIFLVIAHYMWNA